MSFFLAIIFMSALWWPAPVGAAVSGVCADCHVMHASQVRSSYSDAPRDYLLNDSCLGCHTGTNTDGTSHPPYVYTTGATTLAGGNFHEADTDQRRGHNPEELAGGFDTTLTSPPGWKTGFNAHDQVGGSSPDWSSNHLSCTGTYGCHGRHTADGIYQSHHNNPTTQAMTSATTVATSYRFLYGIKGYEDDDYEVETTTDHNIYYGAERSGGESTADRTTATADTTATMSYFCAECHGIFHSGSGSEGISDTGDTFFTDPWIRHPVDVSMPTSGEYASYSYTTDAPVASSDVSDGTINVASSADRIVMCLSCHRAHASPYYAALRWDYRGSGGSWTNGCANCHTDKG